MSENIIEIKDDSSDDEKVESEQKFAPEFVACDVSKDGASTDIIVHDLSTNEFRCSLCHETSETFRLARTHLSKKHEIHYCPGCPFLAKDDNDRRHHIRTAHANNGFLICTKCPNWRSKNLWPWNEHMDQHLDPHLRSIESVEPSPPKKPPKIAPAPKNPPKKAPAPKKRSKKAKFIENSKFMRDVVPWMRRKKPQTPILPPALLLGPGRTYECTFPYCSFMASKIKDMENHERDEHLAKCPCPRCQFECAEDKLGKHIVGEHYSGQLNAFPCTLCEFPLLSAEDWYEHMKDCSNETDSETDEAEEMPVEESDYDPYDIVSKTVKEEP